MTKSSVEQSVDCEVVPAGISRVQELAALSPGGADSVGDVDHSGLLKAIDVPLSHLRGDVEHVSHISRGHVGMDADRSQDSLPICWQAISTRAILLALAVRLCLEPPYFLYLRMCRLYLHTKRLIVQSK